MEPSTYYRCNVFFVKTHASLTNASLLFFYRTFYVFLMFSDQNKPEAFRNEEKQKRNIYWGINYEICDNCFVRSRSFLQQDSSLEISHFIFENDP